MVVPVVAAAVLLGGGAVAAWQLWPGDRATSANPRTSTSAATTQPTSGATTGTPSAAGSTPAASGGSSGGSAAAGATEALQGCRAKVRAGDQVIDAARTGVGHWAIHVESQFAADAGRITVTELDARFKRTRLAGPEDQKRYRDSLATFQQLDGSCDPVAGAPASVSRALTRCAEREHAQTPVLAAGADGMADWAKHLADMQRNKAEHNPGAQDLWVRTYRAAPPHIDAFTAAVAAYDPPSC